MTTRGRSMADKTNWVTWGPRHLSTHHALQGLDVPAKVSSRHVHIYGTGQHTVFVPHHRRARQNPQGDELGQWHRRAGRRGGKDTLLLGSVPTLIGVNILYLLIFMKDKDFRYILFYPLV
jgi:hypothetical protein